MPLLLTSAQGSEVVRLARRTLDSYVSKEERPESARWTGYLGERRGAFVTLNLLAPEGESLRGCIGFPYPVKELGEAVVEATIGAASEDPRFPPVQPSELTGILVEVRSLTKPETIKVGKRIDIPSTIRSDTDELIISTTYQTGLHPQQL